MAFPGADVSIAPYASPFEYVGGSIFVRNRQSDSFKAVFAAVVGKVSSAADRDAARCGVPRHLRCSEQVRHLSWSC